MIVPISHDGRTVLYLVCEEGTTQALADLRRLYRNWRKTWPTSPFDSFVDSVVEDFDDLGVPGAVLHTEMSEEVELWSDEVPK